MDKNTIKKYAIWARRELIEKVTAKAVENEIIDGKELDENLNSINGEMLSDSRKRQRKALIQKIKQEGYNQVMEEVAYTWFNRFIAIRFMEVNGYLPSHVRVFSDDNGNFNPQILSEAIHIESDKIDMNKVMQLKEESNDDELFKYLLIFQCNDLNDVLPYMFAKIEDYTELLLPDYLLREGSVIEKLVNKIPEVYFDINSDDGQIEIIGWMYQYYISEKHEAVVDPLHGKIVKKDEVPAATQLFTTDWVVQYLIDNSVGRYWIERNPESKLADELTYFVKPKDGIIKTVDEKITPQDVTVFDPCVGSGHFLVYAFEVLMKIYVEYGYSERDAADEIVKNNLFGLDIDGRAAQLAYFAVMMKARYYDRRFFTRNIHPNVYEIKESNDVDMAHVEYFNNNDISLIESTDSLINILHDAKEYGSILQMPEVDFERINERFEQISVSDENKLSKNYLLGCFRELLYPAEIMSKKYAVVATNPPYMNKYDAKLKDYINKYYKEYSGDLFSVFIYRNFGYCKKDGYSGFMTPFVWMFIKTYEKLREYIINNKSISSLIQMEYSAYEEATVPICSFVLRNCKDEIKMLGIRLSDFKGGMDVQKSKVLEAVKNVECNYLYEINIDDFEKIPGMPIAYWVSEGMYKAFINGKKFTGETKKGVLTGDNNRFLRLWYEVNIYKTSFVMKNHDEMVESGLKWFPVTSGGLKRKWYGNFDTVVNLENDGFEIRTSVKNYRLRDNRYYFLEAITWTEVSSGMFSCRYVPKGILFGNGGPVCFFFHGDLMYNLGLLNSKVVHCIMTYMAPTINYGPEQVEKIPVFIEQKEKIEQLVYENVNISKEEWDSFEISWDFEAHPCVKFARLEKENNNSTTIKESYEKWEKVAEMWFNKLKDNEEEINYIFINMYGLGGELKADVADKDVTVCKADYQRDIKNFISYAVGCMFGRYSLDIPGLAYAGGTWDASKYKTFIPDDDAIIPICDDEYFGDDIVGRFVEFVEVVYGKETLEENLQFIADALGGKGSSREVIRNYFINDFYKDHLKTYQKRPIYWLFDSGKKNGFKCLIYMHRYQPDTIARIRTDYVHEQQARYRTAMEELTKRIESASGSDKVKLTKKLNTIKTQDEELHIYEEKIHHLADQMISIDLDDGVKVNYAKFQDVLAKIK